MLKTLRFRLDLTFRTMKDQQNIWKRVVAFSQIVLYSGKSATIRIDRWSPRQGLPTRDEPPALAGVYDPSEAFAFVVILTRMTPRSCGHTYRTTCSSRISQKVLKKELILKMLNTKKTTSINYSKIFSYSMSLYSGVKWRVPTCWTPRIKAKISPDCWRLMKDWWRQNMQQSQNRWRTEFTPSAERSTCEPPCTFRQATDKMIWILFSLGTILFKLVRWAILVKASRVFPLTKQ